MFNEYIETEENIASDEANVVWANGSDSDSDSKIMPY